MLAYLICNPQQTRFVRFDMNGNCDLTSSAHLATMFEDAGSALSCLRHISQKYSWSTILTTFAETAQLHDINVEITFA